MEHIRTLITMLVVASAIPGQRDPQVNYFPNGALEQPFNLSTWSLGRKCTLALVTASVNGAQASQALEVTTPGDAGSLQTPTFGVQLMNPGSSGMVLRCDIACTQGAGLLNVVIDEVPSGPSSWQRGLDLVEARTGYRFIFRAGGVPLSTTAKQFDIRWEWTNTDTTPMKLLFDNIEVYRGHDLGVDLTPQIGALTTTLSTTTNGTPFTSQAYLFAVDLGSPAVRPVPLPLWSFAWGYLYLATTPGASFSFMGPSVSIMRGSLPQGVYGIPIYVQPFALASNTLYAGEWRSFTLR